MRAREKNARTKSKLTPIPDDFALTDDLRRWATKNGITHLEERFEHFREKVLAKGYQNENWPAAFQIACREDWLRNGKAVPVPEPIRASSRILNNAPTD